MELDADSSVCSNCHAETYKQWQASLHAKAGVQCIGCHLSHSQDFRLTDEALCGACHRDRLEDFAHTTHKSAEVGCTDCHLSSAPVEETAALASAAPSMGGHEAPSHSFTVVSSQACVGCHGQTSHEQAPRSDVTPVADVRLLALADQAPELAAQLEAAEQAIKSLRVMTLVSLGLGMGIGGMLGIVFMLVVGYVIQGRAKP
jgi:formate-dependent nitrite reductase cytochrome c552 subunit